MRVVKWRGVRQQDVWKVRYRAAVLATVKEEDVGGVLGVDSW